MAMNKTRKKNYCHVFLRSNKVSRFSAHQIIGGRVIKTHNALLWQRKNKEHKKEERWAAIVVHRKVDLGKTPFTATVLESDPPKIFKRSLNF